MAVNIGPRIGIDGESEYRQQIQNIIQQTKTLKSEYSALSASFDKGNTSLKQNAEQHRILAERIKVQKEEIKSLEGMVKASANEYGEADTKTLKWQESLNKANQELAQMERELQNLPNNVELLGQKMDQAGNKIKTIGSNIEGVGRAIAPVSAAAAGALTVAGKSFMDFESQMSRVAAISGATGEDFDKLNEKAKQMGESTKFSATESGQAFEYMAMAGWKTDQMLEGIAPIMNLATASGEELATTSDIVTDALTALGLKAEDAGHFADVLAAASSNANTNVAMMGESFKYAAPVAGSFGYSIEDVAVALGLMANSGIKADMAGTSLRNMMQRMAKPTKESQMAMDRLGLSLADSEGNMYSLRQIMDQMRSGFGNLKMPAEEFNKAIAELETSMDNGEITEKEYTDQMEELARQAFGAEGAEKARAAAMLGGTRAMAAMLSIANATEEDYQKLTAAVDSSSESFAKLADGSIVPMNEALASGQKIIEEYNGTAEQMAAIMKDNAAGAWTEAKSAMEGAAIEAGEVLAPYIKQAAEAVKELAQWFSSLDQEQQETIVKIGALVAAAGPALIIGGKVIGGIGSIVSAGGGLLTHLGSLTGAIGGTSAAAGGLSAGMGTAAASIGSVAAPVAAVVGTLGLLSAAFIQAYNDDEQFASEVNTAWSGIQESITGVIEVVKPAWDGLVEHMKPGFLTAMDDLKARIDQFKNDLEAWINIISGIFEGDWGRVMNGFEELGGSTLNNITSKIETETSAWEGIFKALHLELPHIKLPHFSVTGKNEYGLPSFSIDWYAKAMQGGMRLSNATIFGMANGKFLAGGEAGNEWVVGENSLMSMIRTAVAQVAIPSGGNSVNIGDTQIIINATAGQDVNEIAEAVDEIINMRLRQAEAAWA